MSHGHLKWPGLTSSNTLIIRVDRHNFDIKPGPVNFSGKVFIPKQEAHITVFGSELGTHLLGQFVASPETEHQLCQAFESTDWSYVQTGELRRLARVNTDLADREIIEESIIMLIEMPGMAAFYSKLKTLGLIRPDHPLPPPHVTLYTRNCDLGIGIHSDSELAELSCEHVTLPG